MKHSPPLAARYWFTLIVVALLLLGGCRSRQGRTDALASAPEAAVPSDFELFITRTGCFGQCPVYELYVDSSGLVRYQGHNNVSHVGRYQKQLSQRQMQALVVAIEEADFFAFAGTYDDGATDLPTVITEVEMKGKRHKVINRSGPKELGKLQDRLDAIIGDEGYEPVKKK